MCRPALAKSYTPLMDEEIAKSFVAAMEVCDPESRVQFGRRRDLRRILGAGARRFRVSSGTERALCPCSPYTIYAVLWISLMHLYRLAPPDRFHLFVQRGLIFSSGIIFRCNSVLGGRGSPTRPAKSNGTEPTLGPSAILRLPLGLPVFRVSPASACRRHYPGGIAECMYRSLPQRKRLAN
jgi:hypothetical protein